MTSPRWSVPRRTSPSSKEPRLEEPVGHQKQRFPRLPFPKEDLPRRHGALPEQGGQAAEVVGAEVGQEPVEGGEDPLAGGGEVAGLARGLGGRRGRRLRSREIGRFGGRRKELGQHLPVQRRRRGGNLRGRFPGEEGFGGGSRGLLGGALVREVEGETLAGVPGLAGGFHLLQAGGELRVIGEEPQGLLEEGGGLGPLAAPQGGVGLLPVEAGGVLLPAHSLPGFGQPEPEPHVVGVLLEPPLEDPGGLLVASLPKELDGVGLVGPGKERHGRASVLQA